LEYLAHTRDGLFRVKHVSAETGERLFGEKRWEQVIEYYEASLKERPRWLEGRVRLAYALERRSMEVSRRPVDTAAWPTGSEMRYVQRVCDAIGHCREALELLPGCGDAYFVKGLALFDNRWSLADAKVALKRAKDKWARGSKRVLPPHETTPLCQSAIEAIDNILADQPKIAHASRHMALAARALLRRAAEDEGAEATQEGLAHCTQALALAPENERLCVEAASRLWDFGEHVRCIQALEDSLSRNPRSARLNGALGFFLWFSGRPGRAEHHLKLYVSLLVVHDFCF
jgi:tetratricopeptide (TPR) repeat protein